MSVSPARSDIECAGICASKLGCRHFRFAVESLSCALYDAGSGGAGGTSEVAAFEADATNCPYMATLGDRSFCTFQERNSASVSFERTWTEYEAGFGDGSNFWIGEWRSFCLLMYQ
uniref:Fibrinogen C-terminal domain-containing protein n=1 Tax=Macrostomum lignano TaxID=282301 RepID=A0A1I8H1E1_9PLAT